jgi:ribosome-associated toxin RatA of RatAB toxin-antitoxin module
MKRISRSAIVQRSAEAVYALVEDIEDYPSFLPRCLGTEVKQRTADRTVATLTFGFPGLKQSFTTENSNVPGRSIDMRLLDGPFRHFRAAWRFTPLGEKAAKIEFSMEYEFSNRIVAKALAPAFGGLADSMVEAFSSRAEQELRPES